MPQSKVPQEHQYSRGRQEMRSSVRKKAAGAAALNETVLTSRWTITQIAFPQQTTTQQTKGAPNLTWKDELARLSEPTAF